MAYETSIHVNVNESDKANLRELAEWLDGCKNMSEVVRYCIAKIHKREQEKHRPKWHRQPFYKPWETI